jgi:hypothetical protein
VAEEGGCVVLEFRGPLFCAKSAEATEKVSLRGALFNARVRDSV